MVVLQIHVRRPVILVLLRKRILSRRQVFSLPAVDHFSAPVGCSLTQPAILLLSHWLRQPRSLFLFLHWSSDGWQESWSSGSQTAFILQEIVPKSRALLVPGQTIAPRRGVNIYCSLTFALRLLSHQEYPSPIFYSFNSPFHFNHYKWYLSESHHNKKSFQYKQQFTIITFTVFHNINIILDLH